MSAVDRARWRAWGGVADIMGLGPIEFRPIRNGWTASAKGKSASGDTAVDALAALCRKVAVSR